MQGDPGFVDLVLLNPEKKRFIVIELKSQVGKVSEEQARWIWAFDAAKIPAYVFRPSDLSDGTIERTLRGET